MLYITNSFSLNMLADSNASILSKVINTETVRKYMKASPRYELECRHKLHIYEEEGTYKTRPQVIKSIVGHKDIASVMSNILGYEVIYNRESISLDYKDELIVAQYKGERLPEGCTELPEGASIEWIYLIVEAPVFAYGIMEKREFMEEYFRVALDPSLECDPFDWGIWLNTKVGHQWHNELTSITMEACLKLSGGLGNGFQLDAERKRVMDSVGENPLPKTEFFDVFSRYSEDSKARVLLALAKKDLEVWLNSK